MSEESKAQKQSRGTVLRRLLITLVYLEKPRTVKELAEHLGIQKWGATIYLRSFRQVGLSVKTRERVVLGRGLNPAEFWIDCEGIVVLETCRMWAKLKGM